MEVIDRKYRILAVNPLHVSIHTEKDSLLLLAKDRAVPAALKAYRAECVVIGANPEHIDSIDLLIKRVEEYQAKEGWRVPDTTGAEIDRCINGNLPEETY